jgi:hypothetical protein
MGPVDDERAAPATERVLSRLPQYDIRIREGDRVGASVGGEAFSQVWRQVWKKRASKLRERTSTHGMRNGMREAAHRRSESQLWTAEPKRGPGVGLDAGRGRRHDELTICPRPRRRAGDTPQIRTDTPQVNATLNATLTSRVTRVRVRLIDVPGLNRKRPVYRAPKKCI